jgi:hypothetical protein
VEHVDLAIPGEVEREVGPMHAVLKSTLKTAPNGTSSGNPTSRTVELQFAFMRPVGISDDRWKETIESMEWSRVVVFDGANTFHVKLTKAADADSVMWRSSNTVTTYTKETSRASMDFLLESRIIEYPCRLENVPLP